MGKKQHSKDRLFITQSEWKNEFGGKKEKGAEEQQYLPYNSCCLSMRPVVDGMMTTDGYLFEKKYIYKYIKDNHMNPCTGKKLMLKDLFPVHFHKNVEGEIHCPVTYKVFTQYSKIAVIRTSGNVYLYDCVKDLNISQKNWTDLITGEPFTKEDIIILQDPSQPDHRDVSKFYHVQKGEEEKSKNHNVNVKISSGLQKIVDNIKQKADQKKQEDLKKKQAYELNRPRSTQTSNSYTSSFTSTTITKRDKYEYATDEEIENRRYDRARRLGKKGYVQLVTSLGTLNLEIHCDLAPRTSENFIGLCNQGKYNNTIFHRLIKNFMVQGGDPTGTGTGGQSIWGHSFKDEFHPSLTHKGLGIVSMANSGPNTNNSQFFITFKTASHLDNLHSVFGRVVGGLNVLQEIEQVKTDASDRPLRPLMIAKANVLVNPFEEVDEMIRRDVEVEKKKEELEKQKEALKMKGISEKRAVPTGMGLGSLLNIGEPDEEMDAKKKNAILEQLEEQEKAHNVGILNPAKKIKKGGFGDFSSW